MRLQRPARGAPREIGETVTVSFEIIKFGFRVLAKTECPMEVAGVLAMRLQDLRFGGAAVAVVTCHSGQTVEKDLFSSRPAALRSFCPPSGTSFTLNVSIGAPRCRETPFKPIAYEELSLSFDFVKFAQEFTIRNFHGLNILSYPSLGKGSPSRVQAETALRSVGAANPQWAAFGSPFTTTGKRIGVDCPSEDRESKHLSSH